LSKELRAVMAQALAGGEVAEDPLDQLKTRRDEKRAGMDLPWRRTTRCVPAPRVLLELGAGRASRRSPIGDGG
jgi:hypothetical protein